MKSALAVLREMKAASPEPVEVAYSEPPLPVAPVPERPAPDGYSPAVSAVLDTLVQCGRPVPHPQIVAALVRRGQGKEAARGAIAYCQAQRWIEHDLVSGYVLAGNSDSEGGDNP